MGTRDGLACAESFGLVPSVGEVGAPYGRILAGGWFKRFGAHCWVILWCFVACEGPLVGLRRHGHIGTFSSCSLEVACPPFHFVTL